VPSVNIPVAVNCSVVPSGMDALGGVTEIATNWAGVTVSTVLPDTPPLAADMVVCPTAFDVATPAELIIATADEDEAQVTELLMSSVLPFEYVPVAWNCCCVPSATEGLAGVTAIETIARLVTVKVAEPLISPCVARMIALPAPTPVARPRATVATEVLDEFQVADAVRFCWEPSL
jgi:hypothetical protein